MDYENRESRDSVVFDDVFCECVGLVGLGSLVASVFCNDVSMDVLGGIFLVPAVVKYSAKIGGRVFDRFVGGSGES